MNSHSYRFACNCILQLFPEQVWSDFLTLGMQFQNVYFGKVTHNFTHKGLRYLDRNILN